MSTRGSFVTQYIHCKECLEVAKRVLLADSKFLRGVSVPSWTGCAEPDLPIIAGKIGGLYSCEEIDDFEHEFVPKLAASICHPMRVAVVADDGERIFFVKPSAGGDVT